MSINPNLLNANMKACLFNLIVYTEAEKCSKFLKSYIDQLSKKFPFRLINIELLSDPNVQDISVTAAADATDKLYITTPKSKLSCVPLLILPYLVPDLPIYLMWGQDPTIETSILPSALKYSSRLIFDSCTPENLQTFSQKMIALSDLHHIGIIDLSWIRSSGWRTTIANTFDNHERLEQLKASKIIQISYAINTKEPNPHPARQAIYLQAWLGTQLKWKFLNIDQSNEKIKIAYRRGKNQQINVELHPLPTEELPSGEILEVDIATASERYFSIKRKNNLPQIIVHVSNNETCEMPFALTIPDWQKGQQIVKEVFYQDPSQQYLNMLHNISNVDWRSQ